MAISATTSDSMVLGPGALLVDGSDVGATKENATFTIERQSYAPELNGSSAPLQGTRYVFREIPKLTVQLSEFEMSKLAELFPHGTLSGDGATTAFDIQSSIGRVASAAHKDVTFVVSPGDGKDITLTIYRALVDFDSDFSAEFGNEADGTHEVTFIGYADPADATTAPYKIEKAL